MIAALTGQLVRIDQPHAYVQVGPMLYELLVPAADAGTLADLIGQELTLHTLFYIEGDANRGGLEPRLIGFLRVEDKRFFELFTTVKGIGPKTALRALTVSVSEIAAAIETKNARFLVTLDGIGKRTAELIVAELAGKAGRFVSAGIAPRPARAMAHSQAEEDAIALMVTGGEKRVDAERLLLQVKSDHPELTTTEKLWQEMLRRR